MKRWLNLPNTFLLVLLLCLMVSNFQVKKEIQRMEANFLSSESRIHSRSLEVKFMMEEFWTMAPREMERICVEVLQNQNKK